MRVLKLIFPLSQILPTYLPFFSRFNPEQVFLGNFMSKENLGKHDTCLLKKFELAINMP